jgi:L-aspartate oxidase
MKSAMVKRNSSEHETDLLVIGAGLAGQVAALSAGNHAKVCVLAKTPLTASSSSWAQGGIAAAISIEDSPEQHFEDTIRVGRGLCNESAVRVLTREGPQAIHDLVRWGVEFERGKSAFDLGMEGGHSKRRIAHARGGATGRAVMEALSERLKNNSNIDLKVGLEVLELVVENNRCIGVQIFDEKNNEIFFMAAKAVILATGGTAGLFLRSTNPSSSSGSGVALAMKAGAELQDLEFIQFHPTALNDESDPNARTLLITEAVRGEGAYLLNADGERFMPEIHPLAELAPRDIVAREISQQIERTGAVNLSLAHSPPKIVDEKFYSLRDSLALRGYDLARDLIPIAPAAHYMMGGVKTTLEGATSLNGLYACGEVSCTGVHGANRLASNSLLECVVFGKRVAKAALQDAESEPNKIKFTKSFDKGMCQISDGIYEDLRRFEDELKEIMSTHFGLVRSRLNLESGIQKLRKIGHETSQIPNCVEKHRFRSQLLVAELIASASLERTETRGSHARDDYPKEDPKWRKSILLKAKKELQLC